MPKRVLILAVFMLVFLAGCAAKTISPVDRALIFIDQYHALEITYKNQYTVATDIEKQWLSEKVAPVIDEMREAVKQYTQIALLGHDARSTRVEIVQLYRKAAIQLTQEVLK